MSEPKKIIEMFVFVSIASDGSEGMAGLIGDTWHPFVTNNEKTVQHLLPKVKDISAQHNRKFKILRFTTREDITEKIK